MRQLSQLVELGYIETLLCKKKGEGKLTSAKLIWEGRGFPRRIPPIVIRCEFTTPTGTRTYWAFVVGLFDDVIEDVFDSQSEAMLAANPRDKQTGRLWDCGHRNPKGCLECGDCEECCPSGGNCC